jgi:glucose/arabinose dehydrogenase
MTTGAPFGEEAQMPANVYGKVLRMTEDGGIPADNPFIDTAGARGEVFTLGHRDQLGLTVHPGSGAVLSVEHGPNGGDEVNLIRPGRNYGWPVYSFGRTYEGPRQSAAPLGPDTEQPLVLWIPSIGPSGLSFYAGNAFPEWQGNLFVGSARRGQIPGTGGLERVVFNESLEELRRESLLGGLRARVRDVREGPDGLLYVLTDDQTGALLRISPR